MAELELQENWRTKLWRLAEAKPIHYWSSRDLTTFWRIKLWRIGNEPPNPPKFSPAKVLCYTVEHIGDVDLEPSSESLKLLKSETRQHDASYFLVSFPDCFFPFLFVVAEIKMEKAVWEQD